MANSMDGQNTVLSVVGPLSHSVASLRLATKSLLSQQPWLHDPSVHELPWRAEQEEAVLNLIRAKETPGQLAFGIFKDDGAVTPHPPVKRAMEIITETIQRLGHKVNMML